MRTPVGSVVAVGGCWAQSQKEEVFTQFPFVDIAFGPGEVSRLGELLARERLDAVGAFSFGGAFGGTLPAALAANWLAGAWDQNASLESIAPGVATTVPGGPTYREAQLCMEMVADTGRLASLDIVEINPAYDTHNNTAELAVDLVESLFGKSTLMRQRGAR